MATAPRRREDPAHPSRPNLKHSWLPVSNKVLELRKVKGGFEGLGCLLGRKGGRLLLQLCGVLRSLPPSHTHTYTPPHTRTHTSATHTTQRATHNKTHPHPLPRPQLCNHPLMVYPEEARFWGGGIVTSCGKMFWLDRLLVKLFHTKHRVLLFSTMTRLLDLIEDYLK